MNWKPLLLIIPLSGALVLLFQNCSTRPEFNGRGDVRYAAGGEPYDGKIYGVRGACADGGYSTLVQLARSGALLVRENCQTLDAPRSLAANEYQISADSATMSYQNQTLVEVAPVANKITFQQIKEIYMDTVPAQLRPIAFASAVSDGNLVVCSAIYRGSIPLNSVTDSQGNTYRRALGSVPVAPSNPDYLGQYLGDIWYAEGVRGGANFVVTLNFAGATDEGFASCSEYSGVAPVNALEKVGSTSGTSVGTIPLATVNLEASNQLLYTALWGSPQRCTLAPGVDSVSRFNAWPYVLYMDRITTRPGVFENQAVYTNTSAEPLGSWLSVTASFRAL